MRLHKIIFLKIYLFYLFWFSFYNFLPPLLSANIFKLDYRALTYSLLSILFFSLGYILYKKNIYFEKKQDIKLYQLQYLFIFILILYFTIGTFFAFFYAVISGYYSVKLYNSKKFFQLLIVVFITLSLLIFEFTRMYILSYILFIFLFFYLQSYKFYFVRLIVLFLFAISLLIGLLYIRSNKEINVKRTVNVIKENPEIFSKMIDIYFVYNIYTKVLKDFPKNHNYIYGESLIKPLFAWIPRAIWEKKPESLPLYIGRYYYGSSRGKNYSTGMTIVGEFYINGGIVGIILFSFIFGIQSVFFVNKFLIAKKESTIIVPLVYFIIFPSLMRGGVAATVIMFMLFIVLISFFNLSRKYYKKVRVFNATVKNVEI